VQLIMCSVVALAAARSIDGVELATRTDLQEQLAVGRILLDHGIGIARDEDVAHAIDETAVDRIRHRGLITPRPHDVAIRVELDY
jgi:hypothetical protein